ncbi:MAG: chorismate mutase / prephenate dehydratase [Frankiales bacterium]|nr:chorismate mutase / prephenate dehydratase [Frankiales bacterium]
MASSLEAVAAVPGSTSSTDPTPAHVVLLSDGTSTVGRPVSAAVEQAVAAGVPVSTIAYGTPRGEVVVEQRRISVPVDAPSLAELAADTSGTAYEAVSGDELDAVYADIGSAIGTTTETREIGSCPVRSGAARRDRGRRRGAHLVAATGVARRPTRRPGRAAGGLGETGGMRDPLDLDRLRRELDLVDRQLVELIARRLEVVADVGRAKAVSDSPVRDVRRERQVLDGVAALAEERGVAGELVRRIFREIIGHAVDRQVADLTGTAHQPLVVAYQGTDHAYSHLAAQKHMAGRRQEATYVGHVSFADALASLLDGQADLALLPIENTTAGSINQVYDLLQAQDVHVVGEETWRVDHCLAAVEDVALSRLTRVLSHPQGLEQCAAFLRTLPQVVPVTVFDTAEAVRVVAERGDPTWAAIGSAEAADAHNLVVLRRGLADRAENWTRFLLLSRSPAPVPDRVPSKTSLVLVARHEEGALLRCLEILSRSGHSLTKLESRPRPGSPFEYLFFLDFQGNVADPVTSRVVDELRAAALSLKVLGSYPAKVVGSDLHSDDALEALLPPVQPAT